MKISLAKKKYKKYWKKMQAHLKGVTASYSDGELDTKKMQTFSGCSRTPDNEVLDIPERDLEFAFDMATKGTSDIPWD